MICLDASKATTLVELLRSRASDRSEQIAYTFLVDGEAQTASLTYGELDRQARAIAVYLRSYCQPGERALLLYPPGLEYIAAFFGCLYAGIIAVPAYPPRPNRSLLRIQAMIHDAQATVALTTPSIFARLERRLVKIPELKTLYWLSIDVEPHLEKQWQEPNVNSSTVAFLQYTSGSTATPKGVAIAHSNLLHNLSAIFECFSYTPNSRGVIWLPPYHDMGLIGGTLQPLYSGLPVVLMSPLMFLQSPVRWLQAISHYRATTSGGPNFAYDLCVRKITAQQMTEIDLSCWEVAFNGAEPIDSSTLERFAAKFEPYGFRREAFYPCYGMAEATLIISGGLKTASVVSKSLQGEALGRNKVVPAQVGDSRARTVVGCGNSISGQQIAIAHPDQLRRCASREIGEIWVRGASIAQGYWNNSEATNSVFNAYLADTDEGPFLRTGDLGFLEGGELFVTGRLKDAIVINGQNHYPQDIERTVEQSHSQIRPTCSAAFSINVAGEEKLIVAAEVERSYLTSDTPTLESQLIQSICRAVSKDHDLSVYRVLLLKPGSIPKTSSGKIQRQACRSGFLEKTLEAVNE